MIKETYIPMIIGLILDFILGDPTFLPHPIVYMGKVIKFIENKIRHNTDQDEDDLIKGMFLATIVILIFSLIGIAITLIPNVIIRQILLSIVFFYCIARKTLGEEAILVKKALKESLQKGRKRVSRIVGRDTNKLDEEGIIKATIETVAENTSDGIIAPLFWGLILGAPGILAYKAINTMDSMIGYKNKKYLYFGKSAAKIDDFVNLIPSRITGLLAVLASFTVGGNIFKTLIVFLKDRYNHESPNSAQCEAAYAGALNIKLNGPSYYEGKLEDKKYVNQKGKKVNIDDITKSVILMNFVTLFFIIIVSIIYFLTMK